MSITFSSCFYVLKSKFEPDIYIDWMNNFISIVKNFNLVIYTDQNSVKYINTRENPRIKVIFKPIEHFYNYKYHDKWIENHNKNHLLNNLVDWKVNMLWSEKLWFVNETIKNKYFETELYGWCDIGYFRNRDNDMNTQDLNNWANADVLKNIDQSKIHYGCVRNDIEIKNYLNSIVNNKNDVGLPKLEIPAQINCIAGGFFIIHKDKIGWWTSTYDRKLDLYFKNGYLVKDDQIILLDCIFSNIDKFAIHTENNNLYDNWFMFQRILA